MRTDWLGGSPSGPLVPDGRQKTGVGVMPPNRVYTHWGGGTGHDSGVIVAPRTDLWLRRFTQWRGAFDQNISTNARRYWALYRNFDNAPLPGPNQEWRDRTVIPECFKIIETRLPRLVMGQFGSKENFGVKGREEEDELYEESVKILLETSLDEIGKDRPDGMSAFRTMTDGFRYGQIMGHVWFKPYWRTTRVPLKTKIQGPDGRWVTVELLEETYNGVDLEWLGIGDLAIDTTRGSRRWAIERVSTSIESLIREDEAYRKATGQYLYRPDTLEQLDRSSGTPHQEGFEEPRDTEGWPLTENEIMGDPGERTVELWLCWDNVQRTLTKLVNRSLELDHGLAPTPRGIDPYIGVPAVPIPGRAYGDSYLHYVGPLATYQTRIARARADEVLLNIWQQYVIREGALRSNQFLFRPGGVMTLETADPSQPINHDYGLLPRRPVFTEAYSEEQYRQTQAEQTAGADSTIQGVEATSKSRDVSATEVQQRALQGSSRYQMENFYLDVAFKGPLMRAIFDLNHQNLTDAKALRVLGQKRMISLRDLDRPIDIIVGGTRDATEMERQKETQEFMQLAESPTFGSYLKPRELLIERYTNYGRRNAEHFVRTEEERRAHLMEQAAMAAGVASAGGPAGGGGGGSSSMDRPRDTEATTARPRGNPPGSAGAGPSGGSGGGGGSPTPGASSRLLAEV